MTGAVQANRGVGQGRPLVVALLCALLFAAALGLYTRNNGFPYYYHPEEAGKAKQIQENRRNFHHPLLLLTATDLATEIVGRDESWQDITVVGRWVSAAFAAGAIAVLAGIGVATHGVTGGLAVGLIALSSPLLFKRAHLLKEDTALVFGLTVFLLAALRFGDRPTARTARALGVGAALAASGKYMGLVALPIALGMISRVHPIPGWSAPRTPHRIFVRAFLVTAALVNVHLFLDPLEFLNGFGDELEHGVTHHDGLRRSVPHLAYVGIFLRETPWPILALVGVQVAAMATPAHRRRLGLWVIALFPLGYGAILSCSPLTSRRYVLPVVMGANLLAGLGLAELVQRVRLGGAARSAALRAVLIVGLLATVFHAQRSRLVEHWQGFASDNRAELFAWIEANVPPDAVIAQDLHTGLPDPAWKKFVHAPRVLEQTLHTDRWVADLGSLEELRARGVTHIAACDGRYKRLFTGARRPIEAAAEDYRRRRAFYEALFASGEPVWEIERGTIGTLQPGIRLYAIGDSITP